MDYWGGGIRSRSRLLPVGILRDVADSNFALLEPSILKLISRLLVLLDRLFNAHRASENIYTRKKMRKND
jgi:hypothetical protein